MLCLSHWVSSEAWSQKLKQAWGLQLLSEPSIDYLDSLDTVLEPVTSQGCFLNVRLGPRLKNHGIMLRVLASAIVLCHHQGLRGSRGKNPNAPAPDCLNGPRVCDITSTHSALT